MKNKLVSSQSIKDISEHRSLADALFSTTQQRVLGFIFGQPERSFFATELIKLTGGGSGAIQRELVQLAKSGLVTTHDIGTQKHYRANSTSPIFAELCAIVQKTIGITEPLRDALQPIAQQITAAFVFGSVAKRRDTAMSDIDVLVLSDTLDYADLFGALQVAETRLARSVNPTVYTPTDWRDKIRKDNAFVKRISKQPKLFLIGSEESLA